MDEPYRCIMLVGEDEVMSEMRDLGNLFEEEVQQAAGTQAQSVSVVDLSDPGKSKWQYPKGADLFKLNLWQRFKLRLIHWLER